MKVKVLSDSTCDLSPELIKKYDIGIMPLYVSYDDVFKRDGVDTSPEDIYDFVERTGTLPKTSAVNIADYRDEFEKWHQQGYQIVHINIGSGFSSTHHNAVQAAESFENCFVVDSQNLSTGQGFLVMQAAEMAAQGCSAAEIVKVCTDMTERVEASFIINSLDYLYKGGRCSVLSKFGANLLHLKPCIEVQNGIMVPRKKYRGSFENVIQQYVRDKLLDRNDIDLRRIFITHTACSGELLASVQDTIHMIAPNVQEIIETTAGATVTTHCGPNTLGVLFLRR